jgi:U4/U6 small nuclear ribonucleoprotein PRP31
MDEDLLADLDDLGEESYGEEEGSEPEMQQEIEINPDSLLANTKTFHSKQLQQTLAKIDGYLATDRSKFYNSGPVEQDPEYQTIVQANLLNVEVIHEIGNVGKVIKVL